MTDPHNTPAKTEQCCWWSRLRAALSRQWPFKKQLSRWQEQMRKHHAYCLFSVTSRGDIQVLGSAGWTPQDIRQWMNQWPQRYQDICRQLEQEGSYHGMIFYQQRTWLAALAGWPQPQGLLLEYPQETLNSYFRLHQAAMQGQVFSGMLHDLNNTLVPIQAATDMLELVESNRQVQLRKVIQASCNQAAQLLQEMRRLRQTEQTQVWVPLNPLLSSCADILRILLPRHVELQLSLPDKEVGVQSNPTHLRQIFMNLLLNARDAVLQKHPCGRGRIDLRLRVHENAVEVQVGDNGDGIPSQHLDYIWQPFFTTKPDRGNGLGLTMVRYLLELHQGHIQVHSTPGQGALFCVFLPVKPTSIPGITSRKTASNHASSSVPCAHTPG